MGFEKQDFAVLFNALEAMAGGPRRIPAPHKGEGEGEGLGKQV
jgi:hypothetical protein